MNAFNFVLKGISQVLVAYANGLKINANQIDFFAKDQSERHSQMEEKKTRNQPPNPDFLLNQKKNLRKVPATWRKLIPLFLLLPKKPKSPHKKTLAGC